ncbi:MAG: hypothetical protein DDT22_01307 [candidate division WS2 bacterium]|nr:hypothetical protein [Candidatus Lithacetigena glycinireducens]
MLVIVIMIIIIKTRITIVMGGSVPSTLSKIFQTYVNFVPLSLQASGPRLKLRSVIIVIIINNSDGVKRLTLYALRFTLIVYYSKKKK